MQLCWGTTCFQCVFLGFFLFFFLGQQVLIQIHFSYKPPSKKTTVKYGLASAVKVHWLHPFYTTVTKQALMLSPCDSAAWMKTFKCRVCLLRCGRYFNPSWGFDWRTRLPQLALPVVYYTAFPLVPWDVLRVWCGVWLETKECALKSKWKWNCSLSFTRSDS